MKVNRLADGVFTRIVGNSREISSYDRFNNLESEINSSEKGSKMLSEYMETVNKNKNLFQKLSQMEELVMLYRIRENLDIQLSTQREYVYARQYCPRTDTQNQDIRICISKTDFHDIKNLENDKELVSKAESKIKEIIDGIIFEKERMYYSRPVRKSKKNL